MDNTSNPPIDMFGVTTTRFTPRHHLVGPSPRDQVYIGCVISYRRIDSYSSSRCRPLYLSMRVRTNIRWLLPNADHLIALLFRAAGHGIRAMSDTCCFASLPPSVPHRIFRLSTESRMHVSYHLLTIETAYRRKVADSTMILAA